MNILNWNIRGMNQAKKRRALNSIILQHHIDIITIQETKKEDFTNRSLKQISSIFYTWIWLPSNGTAGGILMGLSSFKFEVISTSIGDYTVILLTKETNFLWGITTTYAPIRGSQQRVCWREIRSIRLWWKGPWVLCGYFNAPLKPSDKRGTSFDMRVRKLLKSRRFVIDRTKHSRENIDLVKW